MTTESLPLSVGVTERSISRADAQHAIDSKTKPLGALGFLEECAVRLAVLQQILTPSLQHTRVCVFAADHGVAEEGVSAYPRSVTAEMMKNFNAGGAAINVLSRANGVQVEVIDVGVDADLSQLETIQHAKVRAGSRNCVSEAAMSVDELANAMTVGAAAVKRAVRDGVAAVGLGEMGIGNTTTAAALLGALTGLDANQTVGTGTGVSGSALIQKREVVTRVLALHGKRTDGASALECLRRVGGLELAAVVGATLEACHHRIAIVADGFISTVSVLCAAFVASEQSDEALGVLSERVFFAHRSSEQGHALAIEAFASLSRRPERPILDLDMRLGEGSGAALAMPVLRAATAIMREMATFASAGVSAGDRAEHHN